MNVVIQMIKDAIAEWEFWLTIITAAVAIVALFQTNKQTKLSNKQHLFDRRLKDYLLAESLVETFRADNIPETSAILTNKDDSEALYTFSSIHLLTLTNNQFLDSIFDYDGTLICGANEKKLFGKCHEINIISTEMGVLFKGKAAQCVVEFLDAYVKYLRTLYLYASCVYYQKDKLRGFHQLVSEKERKDNLIIAYDEICNKYEKLIRKDALKKLGSQIKLQ